MSHSKVTFAAGTLLLIVAGVLVGKASATFSGVSTVYISTGSGMDKHCAPMTGLIFGAFTTAASVAIQATIKTANGFSVKLWATSTCSAGGIPVHFKF